MVFSDFLSSVPVWNSPQLSSLGGNDSSTMHTRGSSSNNSGGVDFWAGSQDNGGILTCSPFLETVDACIVAAPKPT